MKTKLLQILGRVNLAIHSSLCLFLGATLVWGLLATRAQAFSLLGPCADWMDVQKGYSPSVGGPMNIGEGYRWNVPVITYGFDRSFLDYFGSNGVAAVEGAIAILNQLPPASAVDLSNYPLTVWQWNVKANSYHVFDLKSQTLTLLLQEMGLADPGRYVFCIRDFGPAGSDYWFEVIKRNFDPSTGQPSSWVNDNLFTYLVVQTTSAPSPTNVFCDAVEQLVDPLGLYLSAAANLTGGYEYFGYYLTGLSRDDVGGLRYLLNGGQVRCESLLPDVHGVGTSASNLVRIADRPGIDKIIFARHPVGTLNGEFKPFTNRWTDVYYDWDFPDYQGVERITTRPDILFTAYDLGRVGWAISGTANWANNSDLNGNAGGTGPGVIQPPVTITYNNTGPFYLNGSHFVDERSGYLVAGWASYNDGTNMPFFYPAGQSTFQPTQVRFRLLLGGVPHDFRWSLSGPAYGRFQFQTATNLSDWTTLTTLTNSGATFSYQFQAPTNETSRFFRTILGQ